MTERKRVQNIIWNLKRQKFDVSKINVDDLGDLSKVTEATLIRRAKITKETTKGGRAKKQYYKEARKLEKLGIEPPEKPKRFDASVKTMSAIEGLRTAVRAAERYYAEHPGALRAGKKAKLKISAAPVVVDVLDSFLTFLENWTNPIGDSNRYLQELFQTEYEAIYEALQDAIDEHGEEYVRRILDENRGIIVHIMTTLGDYSGTLPTGFALQIIAILRGRPMSLDEAENYDFGQGGLSDEE